MAGKQIIDLASAESFNEGDLLLVRKSGIEVDKKITYTDFIESIGSPAITGYIASLEELEQNKIILKTANNAPIYRYYEGMKISFTAPSKSSGVVQVRIGQLGYKNLYQHKTNIPVSLKEGDYIEAVLIGEHFYQTNNFKALSKVELEYASSFNEGDLLVVKKSSGEEDKRISYTDLVESIGNPAINGYTAILDKEQENKIILKTANNAPLYKYCQGMKISFKTPAKTTGVVQVRIGQLGYKNLYRHKSEMSVSLDADDYVEAILLGEHFYQINDFKKVANIYTNDYICAVHEMPKSGVATDLTLVSAYGLSKQEYYNGMSITFVCPINSQGMVRVNIDGLGAKDLIEGDVEDFLYNTLYKGQIVQAVFNGVCFVKNKFKAQDPKIRASLEPSPTLAGGEAPKAIVPLENMLEFNVGSGLFGPGVICHFPTLRAALEEILSLYSDTSGRRVTLNILSELTTSKDSIVINNRDLSWITIKGDAKNKIKIFFDNGISGSSFFALNSCKNFNFSKDTIISYDIHQLTGVFHNLFGLNDCNFNMQNITIIFLNWCSNRFPIHSFKISGGNISLENIIAKSADYHLLLDGRKSIVSLNNCKFVDRKHGYSIHLNAPNSELTITNCDLSNNGTANNYDIVIGSFASVRQINSKAKANYHTPFISVCKPNTSDIHANYIVTGSQDEVGN